MKIVNNRIHRVGHMPHPMYYEGNRKKNAIDNINKQSLGTA